MTQIKFGTDGWRAVIAKDFTFANVAQAAANPGSQQSDATTRRKQRDAAVN
jgi:phosphomannomutase